MKMYKERVKESIINDTHLPVITSIIAALLFPTVNQKWPTIYPYRLTVNFRFPA